MAIHFGDVKGVVAVLHMNRETLEFIFNELPLRDGFTLEIGKILDELDRRREAERDEAMEAVA